MIPTENMAVSNSEVLSFYLLLLVYYTDGNYSTLSGIFVFTIWKNFVAE